MAQCSGLIYVFLVNRPYRNFVTEQEGSSQQLAYPRWTPWQLSPCSTRRPRAAFRHPRHSSHGHTKSRLKHRSDGPASRSRKGYHGQREPRTGAPASQPAFASTTRTPMGQRAPGRARTAPGSGPAAGVRPPMRRRRAPSPRIHGPVTPRLAQHNRARPPQWPGPPKTADLDPQGTTVSPKPHRWTQPRCPRIGQDRG